ncbi:helix-turn-helix domain-containing protein [Lactiplantibacillus daowaiensis]|uniref:Helix-turn-helix domain-containing protein n=1 Tax=Lactiplantibacillus daowaiensis TaxID=2559918 RepID=A0ABW1RZJ6_9LACO|nr:helix-turn-helix domain-containing protein [Lactiplantibacillus daowaiensis]
MNAQELLTLYPEATIQSMPLIQPNVVCLPLGTNRYICLDKAQLGERELALLELMVNPSVAPTTHDHWSDFLTGLTKTAPVTDAEQLQLLQFRVRFTDDCHQRTDWLAALADLFDDVLHAAFVSDTTGYLLFKHPLLLTEHPDLEGVLTLLDSDFYTTTRLFLGSVQPDLQQLPAVYALEQQLFATQQTHPIETISASLLPDLVSQHHTELGLLNNTLLMTEETQQLITALYQTQGNVRQAAQQLFIHRNTLLYRIEKFERQSGFDLKQMDDLVYCYLLTLAQAQTKAS